MTRRLSLIVALGLLLCSAAGAQAATLRVAKACYFNGESALLKGSGFAPDDAIAFTVNGRRVPATLATNGEGEFEATYALPAANTQTQLLVRATDSAGTAASTRVNVSRRRAVFADPSSTSNVRTWRAVFRFYGFGRGTLFVHYVKPNGKLKKTIELGRLETACGRLRTGRRRVLPFSKPEFGTWRLQFDTRRRYSRRTENKRVIPVRVFPT